GRGRGAALGAGRAGRWWRAWPGPGGPDRGPGGRRVPARRRSRAAPKLAPGSCPGSAGGRGCGPPRARAGTARPPPQSGCPPWTGRARACPAWLTPGSVGKALERIGKRGYRPPYGSTARSASPPSGSVRLFPPIVLSGVTARFCAPVAVFFGDSPPPARQRREPALERLVRLGEELAQPLQAPGVQAGDRPGRAAQVLGDLRQAPAVVLLPHPRLALALARWA